MPSYDSDTPKPAKNGITMTVDFEIVEMNDMNPSHRGSGGRPFVGTTSYSVSTQPPADLEAGLVETMPQRVVDSFKRAPGANLADQKGYQGYQDISNENRNGEGHYDVGMANARTADTGLSRELKGRHLQMIAMGGAIGTGLFVASGIALWEAGPVSMILAYVFIGCIQFCIMQSLGELAVAFPVAGSFSSFSTRFLDPSWGFAMGWNYALQWLICLPLEIIAGALTVSYWNETLNNAIFVTILLVVVAVINLMGIRGYGEAEFLFSTVKATAVVGFILLAVVVNIGGTPNSGYIGAKYWFNPGPTNHGFKGFCGVLVTSSFSFTGTELVGLAAAEAVNPRKTLPSAIKQVFWRIVIFYVVALFLVSLLVPYDDPRLLGGTSSVDASASPFVIAIESAGSTILPAVMNAVILLAVLSVGNSAVFGSSRVLAALAEQSHAPQILSYVDRKGRPLVAIFVALLFGLSAYLVEVKSHAVIFDWFLSSCALSSIFTWSSICLSHIRFRQAWAAAGNTLNQLPYRSQAGVIGSWVAIFANVFILGVQFWIAASPIRPSTTPVTAPQLAANFFQKIMTVPIILLFYLFHKIWYRTGFITVRNMDIDTGRSFSKAETESINSRNSHRKWPRWKKIYRYLC